MAALTTLLLSVISASHINQQSASSVAEHANQATTQQIENRLMELGRYFNADDEPIVLSQSHNHARLVLTRKNKFWVEEKPESEGFLQIEVLA